jgi:hypothetical protein
MRVYIAANGIYHEESQITITRKGYLCFDSMQKRLVEAKGEEIKPTQKKGTKQLDAVLY